MTLEAREKTIKALLQDDDALSREEVETLIEEATLADPLRARAADFAIRCAAQGILLPVRESTGEEGIGEIEDATGTNILQIDPMGMLDDARVSAMAALIVEAINAMGNAAEGQMHA